MSSIVEILQATERIERCESDMRKKWQDLPDELILKILSYSEVKVLISCGQVSKRTRNISHENSLWKTANLANKIVKTELLEMILLKGCKILNLSDSTIVGHMRRNMISQLKVLDLSQSAWGFPAQVPYEENMSEIEELLSTCCSLQNLKMEGLYITSNMAVSICQNGSTLQVLNLNYSFVDDVPSGRNTFVSYGDFRSIIKYCQELKELELNYTKTIDTDDEFEGLSDYDLQVLAKHISPKVEKLNLIYQDFEDEHVKIMLNRCNKIKLLTLDTKFITDDSLETIRQCLNLTLEELTLANYGSFHFCLQKLKSMSTLKVLNLHNKTEDKKVQNLRQQLPHLMIRTFF